MPNDYKMKLEEFDRKMEENYYIHTDSCYFLARMFAFQQKYPDFESKINQLIEKYKKKSIIQETLQTRFQDLTFQVFF